MRLLALLAAICAAHPALADEKDDRKLLEDRARIAALEDQRSLGGGALAAFAVDARAAVRTAAVRALGRIQDAAGRDALVKALADADAGVRREAAFALGQMPEGGVDALVKRYGAEPDAEVKRAIVVAVGRAGGAEAVPFLLRAAERAEALTALGLIAKRSDGALPGVTSEPFDAWLKDAAVPVRVGAAYALMRAKALTDDGALAAAKRCARDADEEVRVNCVRALARFPGAMDALAAAANDASWRIRVEAARGLGERKAFGPLAVVLRTQAEQLAGGKLSPDGPDLHPLVAALDAAIDLPPMPPLVEAAGKVYAAAEGAGLGRSHVRCRAATILDRMRGQVNLVAKCGAPDYPQALREELAVKVIAQDDPVPEAVRMQKAERRGPGRLPAVAARIEALAALYAKATPQGRTAVVEGLQTFPKEKAARALVLKALADKDPGVVATAADTAGEMKLAEATGPLLDADRRLLPAGELEAVQSVFEALGKIGAKEAAPVLEAHIFHPNPALRKAALAAWKAIEGADARPSAAMPAPPPAPGAPDLELARPSPYRAAILHTTKGDVRIELFVDDAPNTVKNFVTLAKKGFYDRLTFHRVVPDFVVQGGDPRGDGWGGPGYTIRCEINPRPYGRGAVGMALAGKDTGGSQFFVTHGPQPHLDGGYTVFGQVREGMAVVDALTVGDRILAIELSRSL
jgi:cyclophilin family peptidyl-prolyl cis-trans isomerase/HEAT repeat protein